MIRKLSLLVAGIAVLQFGAASQAESICLTMDGESGSLPAGWTVNYHSGSPELPFVAVEPSAIPFSPTPPNPVPSAHTGTRVIYMGDPVTGQYTDYLNVTLESPVFTAQPGDAVRYWERVDAENYYDNVRLEIYEVSGSSYNLVYNDTGNNWGWKHRWYEISSAYWGWDIKVVFRFTSDYVISQYMGWLLDDVFIGQDSPCAVSPNCGDGSIDGPFESCDDSNNDSWDGCSAVCVSECGNGFLDASESCDDGFGNGELGTPCQCNLTCSGYTQALSCGDGWICGTEICDNGASNGTPCFCNSTCDGTTPTTCGDGFVCDVEYCDSGAANGQPCACDPTCTYQMPTTCGDGVVCEAEYCDDGAANGTVCNCDAGCSSYIPPACGDGITCGGEGCDEAILNGAPCHCDAACGAVSPPVCGDWVVCGGETCDDGLDNGQCGFCDGTCTGPTNACGNGVTECFEACDDGASNGQCGFCDSFCTGGWFGTCGNGTAECAEQCDDGNTASLDGCNASCMDEFCGDSVIQWPAPAAERCDDGNTATGDGCDGDCLRECVEVEGQFEDFNSGLPGGWMDLLEDGSSVYLWNLSPNGAYAGTGWRTGLDPLDQYENQADTSLNSSWFLLPHVGGFYSATYWENYSTEPGWDFVELRVQHSLGTTVIFSASGSSGGWREHWVDLTPFAGDWVRLIFNFRSDVTISNYPGWKIDDLRVFGCHTCGNGALEAYEGCDDANLAVGDGCDENCIVEACGNSVVQAGEECDDANLDPGDGCSPACVLECGDGVGQGSEQCDDGNRVSGDGCSDTCQSECGNGVLDEPGEFCDDGNLVSYDGCNGMCRIEGCGDGIVLTLAPFNEECDNGGRCSDNGALCTVNSKTNCADPLTADCDVVADDGCDLACARECIFRALDGGWNFDDGTEYWWYHGPGGSSPVDLWHVSTDGFNDGQGFRWSDSVTGYYENDLANLLYSPWVYVSGSDGPYKLKFDFEHDIETYYDSVDVKAYSWWGGTDYTLVTQDGTSGGWQTLEMDLTLAPDYYYFVWEARSDYSVVRPGYRLDNVAVLNCTVCGDGMFQPGELCDDGGDENFDGCDRDCVPEVCGNGILQSHLAETCDDGNLDNGDGCDAACLLECGNGVVEATETCDDGNTNDCAGPCRGDCQGLVTGCGDGVLCAPEACDDGNALSGDGCDALCVDEFCGDNAINDTLETCDDGNLTSGDGCDANCYLEICGNGVLQTGEECDDGNTTGGDGCAAACVIEFCGDGALNNGLYEECDDGANVAGDGCDIGCRLEVCGNGILGFKSDGLGGWVPEQCDDGNLWNNDGCGATCLDEACGDLLVQAGFPRFEICDDGNLVNSDGCDSLCKSEVCGNAVMQAHLGETCDDGNLIDGDGCSSACLVERCGDGGVDLLLGEDCDDGGLCSDYLTPCFSDADCPGMEPCQAQSYDGCSNKCRLETCGSGSTGIYFDSGLGWTEEQCDDGGICSDNAAPCTNQNLAACAAPGSATCDRQSNDGCDAQCRLEYCGDGVLQPLLGEQCDDGCTGGPGVPAGCDFLASYNGDGCDSNCLVETCGNGVLGYWYNLDWGFYYPEDCDDGNLMDGDGCTADCRYEPQLFISSSPPGASVYVNGHPNYPGTLIGQTIPEGYFSPPFFLSQGFIDITVHLPLFAPISRRVFLYQSQHIEHFDLTLKVPETYLQADQLKDSAGAPVNVGSHASPALIDFDCNATLDLLVGRGDGTVDAIHNYSDIDLYLAYTEPVMANYGGGDVPLDVGDQARIAPVDFDADGRMDLIIGNSSGAVLLYQNVNGYACSAVFDAYSQIQAGGSPIAVAGDASPAVGDIDRDGLFDLLVGAADGEVLYYHNSGTPTAPSFDAAVTLFPARGYPVSPSIADLNADGYPDIYVGNNTCGFDLYPNRRLPDVMEMFDGPFPMVFPLNDMVYTQLCDILPAGSSFGIGSNLAMVGADLIKDPFFGRDLIIGDNAGNLFIMQASHMAGDINTDADSNGLDVIQVSRCLDEMINDDEVPSLDREEFRCRQADVPPPVRTLGVDEFGNYDGSVDTGDRERILGYFGLNYTEGDCGNGLVDPGEECDNGGVCSDNGAPCERSIAACANPDTALCLFNGLCSDNAAPCISDKSLCGNEFTATCDPVASGGCGADCLYLCGNNAINFGEACDDGNREPGDGCDPYCQVECGNGWIDVAESCQVSVGDGSCLEACDDGGYCVTQGSVVNCNSNMDCPSGEECRPVGYPFADGSRRCIDPYYGWCGAYWPCPSGEVCVATDYDWCSKDCSAYTYSYYDTTMGNTGFCTAGVDMTQYELAGKQLNLKLTARFYATDAWSLPFTLAFDIDRDQDPATGKPVDRLGLLSQIGIDETLVIPNIRWNGTKWVSDDIRLLGRPGTLDAVFFGSSLGGTEWELQAILSYKRQGIPAFGQFNYIGYATDDPAGQSLCDRFPESSLSPFGRSNLFEFCGNGLLEFGEDCDDGGNMAANPESGDDCDANCFTPVCGDGWVQTEVGEECDAGGRCSDNNALCRLDNRNACSNPGTATCNLGSPGVCTATCQNPGP